jgi:hypothetical protein
VKLRDRECRGAWTGDIPGPHGSHAYRHGPGALPCRCPGWTARDAGAAMIRTAAVLHREASGRLTVGSRAAAALSGLLDPASAAEYAEVMANPLLVGRLWDVEVVISDDGLDGPGRWLLTDRAGGTLGTGVVP